MIDSDHKKGLMAKYQQAFFIEQLRVLTHHKRIIIAFCQANNPNQLVVDDLLLVLKS
ncbi:hypothetical protein SynROS8604_01551 [Synechococcus sp. ROS8604]|nr:hypothetical protein SynROS8604_01551 [Synechococcus sp. ROS8604]